MGNNRDCDVCTGNARNQMDMRRQRAMMYDRNPRGQMMSRRQTGCDSCENTRMASGCDTCEHTRMTNSCDTCERTRMTDHCDTCGNARTSDNCGNSTRDELHGMPLAMGYVPWQNFDCTYEPMQGFRAGTIFPELDKPFYGRRGMR